MTSPGVKRIGGEDNYGYSQAVQVGDTVYISGQRSVHESGRFVHAGNFAAQVKRTFANLDKWLAAVGAKRSHIVNERVFIVEPINHTLMYQSLHKAFFGGHRSASTTIAVPGLAFKGQLIEVAVTLRLDMDSTNPHAPVVKRFDYDLPHEKTFGYTQALQVGNTVYISGQLSHDEHGNFIGPGSFQKQIEQTYANLDKCITAIGASRNQVVNEHVFIVDSVKNAPVFAAAHKKFYGDHLTAASTLIGVDFPVHLIEISATLRLDIDSVKVKRFAHGLPSENGLTQVLQVGENVHISGQLALDEDCSVVGMGDFQAQVDLTYKNLDKCLAAVGATRNQIVAEDVFVVDSVNREPLFRPFHRHYYGAHSTTSTLIGVTGLYYSEQLIEIEVSVRLDIPN